MNNIIEISNLNYLDIFKYFSINFEKNKISSLAGPNNCGKTTLLRLICGQSTLNENITVNNKPQSSYKITEYSKIIKGVFPKEYIPVCNTVEDELNYYINGLFLRKEEKNKRLRNICKNLSLNKLKKTNIKDLTEKELIRLQIALAISTMPKVLLIDDICPYFDNNEMIKFMEYLKELTANYDISIILVVSRLEDILNSDYLYILSNNKVELSGTPIEVLKKDNIINRLGIKIPFMIDLSVKLKDYGLIEDIELDMNRMISELWK